MKMYFHLSLCCPSNMEEAAKEMESMLHSAVGFHTHTYAGRGIEGGALSHARCYHIEKLIIPELDDENTSKVGRYGVKVTGRDKISCIDRECRTSSFSLCRGDRDL